MPAIITYDLKKQLIQSILSDVADSSQRYFVGIGRSQEWDSSDTTPTPVQSFREIRNFRLNAQSIKSAEDVSFVVPRVNWSSGTIYNAWDDNYGDYPSPSYYVVTGASAVYICLRQGKNSSGTPVSSTVEPTGTSTSAFETVDGYMWKFLYTITSLNSSRFLTSNFMPVRYVDSTDSSSLALDIEQENVQNAAVPGQITGVVVTEAGTGYSSAPSVSFVGDGSGASATARVSGGGVVKIEMDNDSSALGSGYTYVDVVLSGGGFTTEASARGVMGPPAGVGADPRDDLKASGVMFNSKPSGEEGGDFITTNDFRQVALIKNVLKHNDSDFTAGSGKVLSYLKLSSVSTAFTADKTIEGNTSGAKAYVDEFDSDTIYFHQTEETSFTPFTEGETINETNGSGSGVLDSAGVDGDSSASTNGDADPFSGTILYIDNRGAIERSSEQTEDIKVVITF